MAENNVTLKTMQYVMGHANVKLTLDIYTHVQESEKIRAELMKLSENGV
jgi:site-specific recombinase XerD